MGSRPSRGVAAAPAAAPADGKAKSQALQTGQGKQIVLSYTPKNNEFMKKLKALLLKHGYNIWENKGRHADSATFAVIENAAVVVVLITKKYELHYSRNEFIHACNKKVPIILLRDVDGYIPDNIDYEFFRNRKFILTSFHDDEIFEEIRNQVEDASTKTADKEDVQVACKVEEARYVLLSRADDQGIMLELKEYLLSEGINVKMLDSSASVAVDKIYDAAVFLCAVTEQHKVTRESYPDVIYAFYQRMPIIPLVLLKSGHARLREMKFAWRERINLSLPDYKQRFPDVLKEVRSLLEPSLINTRSIPWSPTYQIVAMRGKSPVIKKYDETVYGQPHILLCSIVQGDNEIVVQLWRYLDEQGWNVGILEQSENINVDEINYSTIFVVPVSKLCGVEGERVRDIQYAYKRRVPLLPVVMLSNDLCGVTPARGIDFVPRFRPIDLTDFGTRNFRGVHMVINMALSKWVMHQR